MAVICTRQTCDLADVGIIQVLEDDYWTIGRIKLEPFDVSLSQDMAVCQNLVPLVNIKIAGKWMFIPLKMVLIGIDPYPYVGFSARHLNHQILRYPPRIKRGNGQHSI